VTKIMRIFLNATILVTTSLCYGQTGGPPKSTVPEHFKCGRNSAPPPDGFTLVGQVPDSTTIDFRKIGNLLPDCMAILTNGQKVAWDEKAKPISAPKRATK
jgi:hypothetical protein